MTMLLDAEQGKALLAADERFGNIEARTREELWSNPVISAELLRNPVIMRELTAAVVKELPELANK